MSVKNRTAQRFLKTSRKMCKKILKNVRHPGVQVYFQNDLINKQISTFLKL